jgi:hypothetical protein
MGGSTQKSNTQSFEQSTTNIHRNEVEDSQKNEAARLAPWQPVAQDMLNVAGAGRNLYQSNPTGLGAMSTQAITGLGAEADAWASGARGPLATDTARGVITNLMNNPNLGLRGKEIYDTESASERNLQDTAQGKYLSGANPYMDELISRSQRDAANQVAAKFAASGRYGSGNFSTAIADTTGRIATEARMQDYEQERARQMQANQQVDAARMARLGLANQTTIADRQLKASLAQMAPGLDQARQTMSYMPYLTKLGAGQIQDEAPWKTLGLYAGIEGPLAQAFGEQTAESTAHATRVTDEIRNETKQGSESKKTTQEDSPLKSLLGGASLLTGLFGKLSDVRAKENIQRVGELDDGQKVYAYNYKGDPTPEIGLIAQEVEKVKPEAVATGPDGFKRVDYAAATTKAGGKRGKSGKRAA